MRRMLTRAGIVAALFAPALAFAAYNDVSLTTDTVLSVNGITLNVSGSSATIESITVNASDFSVTLPASSTFEVTAPGLNQLAASTGSGMSKDICNASKSVLGFAPAASASTVTVTITPSATLCSSTGSGGSAPAASGGSSSSSGSVSTSTPATATTTTAVATTTSPAVTSTSPAASTSGLKPDQIQSILSLLASFNADQSVIDKVRASLQGTVPAPASFTRNLTVGSTGADVKALQAYLNAHGYPVAASGPGSPGNETTTFGPATKAALAKLQKAAGITPAAGYFGAKTRAYVAAHP